MKRACFLAVFLTAIVSAPALAQAPIQRDPPNTVNLTLEQRHVIRELVRELKTKDAIVESKLSAGDPVPKGVEPQPMPPLVGAKVPQIKSHRFFIAQQQIAIVDPKADTIVEVID
jgi:hypothetical protein